jgi:Ca2+-binding RTX toxin-like protein
MPVPSLFNFPVVFDDNNNGKIPERLVYSGSEDIYFNVLGEKVEITSGFMEVVEDHSPKDNVYAIYGNNPQKIIAKPDAPYNLGIDYYVERPDKAVSTWYGGTVTQAGDEGSYGNRVRIATDVTYKLNGKEYQVFTGYAHLESIGVKEGDKVNQGDRIGKMGATGGDYDKHVDLRIWINVEGKGEVDLSPNALQEQLISRFTELVWFYLFPDKKQRDQIRRWYEGNAPDLPQYSRDIAGSFGYAEQQTTPLVLDLDGDGIELTSVTDSEVVRFDMDMDGLREATGWVNADDGLLVFDRNGDNLINDLSELFGTQVQGDSGFNTLRQLDSNQDNWISAADTAFSQLQVWRDLNQDGYSDADELFSLSQLGISRIQVTFTKGNQVVNGNTITDFATYELTNGTQRQIVDAWFALDQLDSQYDFYSTANQPLAYNAEVTTLPALRGHGNLPDLSIAMAKDAQLLQLVQLFKQKAVEGDATGALNLVRSILFRWAGVDAVTAGSRGPYVDAQELAFLEKFVGHGFSQSGRANPNQNSGPILNKTFIDLTLALQARLLAQVTNGMVGYNAMSDQLVLNESVEIAQQRLDQLQSTSVSELLQIESALLLAYFVEAGLAGNWQGLAGTTNNDTLTGTASSERLYGLQGDDNLNGEAGDDTLFGGIGNDYLNGGEGTDSLLGGNDDDTLNGVWGNDTLDGGAGNDYVVASSGGDFLLIGAEGNDIIFSYGGDNDTLLGGSGDDTLDGGWGSDSLNGGEGNDSLNGGWGDSSRFHDDTLFGGTGNDTLFDLFGNNYLSGDEGDDFIRGAGNLTGGAGNDTLIGGGSLNGGTGNDIIQTDGGNNTYYYQRGDGQDTITGARVTDTLIFGNGITASDLQWHSQDMDVVFTIAGSTGQVQVSLRGTYAYGYLSILVEGQSLNLDAVLANHIWRDDSGNNQLDWWGPGGAIRFDGLGGNDIIRGSELGDTLWGSDGNDTLNGHYGNDSLLGGTGDDSLYGGDQVYNPTYPNQDTLQGGLGNDTLNGGAENDTYLFNRGDGQDVIDDRFIYGNNTSAWNGGSADTLVFGGGINRSDLTWQFQGTDLVFGLTGSTDRVTIKNVFSDTQQIEAIQVAGQQLSYSEITAGLTLRDEAGINTINWRLSSIRFEGLAGNDDIRTSVFDDALWGGDGNDNLDAGDGNDTLNGGADTDTLYGGAGSDILDGGTGNDFLAGAEGNDTYIVDSTDDVIIEYSTPEIDSVTATASYTLGSYVEYLTLGGTAAINGTGNSLNNRITGNGANNSLSAAAGNDTLTGNEGNDTLDGGTGNDSLIGGDGNDTLLGSDGNDTLDGGIGSDSLIGGTGNDIYFVDNTGDLISETSTTATEIDSVTATASYTLGANLENLTLGGSSGINGTGNALNNRITGNSSNNNLSGIGGNDTLDGGAGNDTLDGGIGDDRLIGGIGNDTYIIDSTSDVISETSTTATEIDSVTATVSYTLGSNLENLTLGGSTALNGTGNSLNNQITGNGANNSLTGAAGNDTLDGVAGDDTLNGGDGDDSLIGGDGIDSLLGGNGIDILIGGLGNDILIGGAGNDTLTGGSGSDRFLYDTNAAFSASAIGSDRITDFGLNSDKLLLDKTTFTALKSVAGSGFSVAADFASVVDDAAVATNGAFVVYSRATGNLFYNQNGISAGLGSGAQVATLAGMPALTANDFLIQA